jgi:Surfeit locus protein 2 (SURF2)
MDAEAAPVALSGAAARFVKKYPKEVEATTAGKIRFVLTGMEFPASAADTTMLAQYLAGPAMRRAKLQKENDAFDFDALLPNIIPHKTKKPKDFLWCSLTEKTLPRSATVVQNHINGRKYTASLARRKAAEDERARLAERRAEKAAAKAAGAKAFRERKDAKHAARIAAKRGAEGDDADEKEGDSDDEEYMPVVDSDDEEVSDADDDAMDEDDDNDSNRDADERGVPVDDEPDAFWTRGRVPAAAAAKMLGRNDIAQRPSGAGVTNGSDSDVDDEWGEVQKAKVVAAKATKPNKKVTPLQSKAKMSKSKKVMATSAPAPPVIAADASPIVSGIKRPRDSNKVLKSQRPRTKLPRAAAGAD